MRVATLIRILKSADQQAEVILEVNGNRRFHARDVKIPNAVASGGTVKAKVVISSE